MYGTITSYNQINIVIKFFMVLFQHPVYCVNVVGTQNAHNLISVSTDGKMCSWSLDMLSQPQVSPTCSKLGKFIKEF